MHSLLVAFLLVVFAVFAAASSHSVSQLHPRSNPIRVPIHIHSRGIPFNVNWNVTQLDTNTTSATAGLTPLAFTTDRQSYYTVISIGDIYFRVVLDTGSSDLWIMSTACQTNSCKSLPRYPLAYESPTFLSIANNATPYQVSYADGTAASGFVALETVQLANITVERQAFGMITKSNVTLTDRVSGIMGLGFPRLSSIPSSVNNSTPFFAYLAQQGLLDYPLFGVNLARNTSGSLTIGAIDSSVVTNASNIHWNDVVEFPPFSTEGNSSSYLQWSIPITGFGVGGVRLNPKPTYPAITKNLSYALFDIGTAGIYGPVADVSRLFSRMDGARLVDNNGQWVVPCDTTSTMSLFFGEHEYILQPTDYLIGPASGNPNLCLSWPRATLPSSDGIDWQIGSAFMATVYTIFSFGINTKEAPMIGLYALSNGTNTTETPEEIASFLSTESATIATTLPNYVIPNPTYTTPPYALNSSITAPVGGIVTSGLATSTYSPILGQSIFNVTALPTISPSPTLMTLTTTDSGGQLTTSISTHAMPVVTLGVPPGWNGGHALHAPRFFMTAMPCLVFLWTLFNIMDFAGWFLHPLFI
ncbi:aspartic peptidase A1 [Amanita muscaria]